MRTVNVVDTTPPVITLLGANPMTVQCHATFTDPGATATDTCAGNLTSSIVTSGSVNTNVLGTYTLSYNVQDPSANPATTVSRTVNVVDTTAPVISSASASPNALAPPNHKMRFVTVSVSASDNCDPLPVSKILSVTSSEADSGTGDGDLPNDIQNINGLTVNLRAERSGSGKGRTYTITVQCMDASGNASTKTTTVTVKK